MRTHAGLALIELLVSIVIIGVGMTGIIRALDACVRTSFVSLEKERAQSLLDQVLCERSSFSGKDDSGFFKAPFERFGWSVTKEIVKGTELSEFLCTVSFHHGDKCYQVEGKRLCSR